VKTFRALAAELGCSKTLVQLVKHRRLWTRFEDGTSDIVYRLRTIVKPAMFPLLVREAADEIERLRGKKVGRKDKKLPVRRAPSRRALKAKSIGASGRRLRRTV
jgi:hypothetical protein